MARQSMRAGWRITKWLASGALALILLLIVAGNIFGWYLLRYTQEHFPPPGNLIALQTHRLHMRCIGEGSPTVLLESGGGAWSTHWTTVQSQVASFTRVCSYDRAGLGWSDPGPKPYDIDSAVRDLHELLAQSGEKGPFVFSGWSFGGSIVWSYVQTHPDRSAGLIMVDGRPSGFQTWMNEFAPEPQGYLAKLQRYETKLQIYESIGLGPAYSWFLQLGRNHDPIKGFPAGTGDVFFDPGFRARMFDATIEASASDDISERQMDMTRPLGDLPLIVIRHGREDMFGLAPDKEQVAETRWRELQEQLVKQSTDGKLEVAEKSGHGIPFEQPDIVVDAIKELVMKWRARNH